MEKVLNDWRAEELQFLSNFSEFIVVIHGLEFKTKAHFFQWCKTLVPEEQDRIWNAATSGQAKRLGQSPGRGGIATLRAHWDERKDAFMVIGLLHKYLQHPHLTTDLVNTHPAKLIEGNWWHDNYWGDCWCDKCANKVGLNKLGVMHMDIRNSLMTSKYL